MGDKSQIEWTDATWNPATGCTKVSPGCAHCYIERTPPFRVNHRRFDAKGAIPIQLHPERLTQPLHWRRPRRVFVNSLSDLFHEDIPFSFIDAVFVTMALCPSHAFQILTKRPERMLEFFNFHFPHVGNTKQRIGALMEAVNLPKNGRAYPRYIESWPLKNVWLGVTAENQRFADERIPLLLQTPAAVRFVSAEPLLGPIDLSKWLKGYGGNEPHDRCREIVSGIDGDRSVSSRCGREGLAVPQNDSGKQDGRSSILEGHRDEARGSVRNRRLSDDSIFGRNETTESVFPQDSVDGCESGRYSSSDANKSPRRESEKYESIESGNSDSIGEHDPLFQGSRKEGQGTERASEFIREAHSGASVRNSSSVREPVYGSEQDRASIRNKSAVSLANLPSENLEAPSLNWLIVGGESGPGARPMNPDWARSVRDQCVRAGVPFFFKQWGGINAKFGGRMLDGREWNEYPKGA